MSQHWDSETPQNSDYSGTKGFSRSPILSFVPCVGQARSSLKTKIQALRFRVNENRRYAVPLVGQEVIKSSLVNGLQRFGVWHSACVLDSLSREYGKGENLEL